MPDTTPLTGGRCIHGRSVESRRDNPCIDQHPSCKPPLRPRGTNLDAYTQYVRGATDDDLRRFDAFLLGWLLSTVDQTTATTALDAAAADRNRNKS